MNCKDLEPNLPLYFYGELTAENRAAWDAHFASCAACRARLEEARRLDEVLASARRREPSPELLVVCRQSLEEALDREQLGWRHLWRTWFPSLSLAPATGAVAVLTLVLFGFGLGWTLRPRADSALGTASAPGANSSFLGADLSNLRISNISNVSPDPRTGEVRITLDAERRVTLEGSLDDPRIRQVLVDTMKGYENPGIRRDTLDALKAQTADPAVREAVLYALRQDSNAGVRLEALKSLATAECLADTHTALLDRLEHDPNAGVRVAAVEALVAHAETEGPDPDVETTLERLAATDPNPSVRVKSLTALQRMRGDEF
jgi:hypothetical protein